MMLVPRRQESDGPVRCAAACRARGTAWLAMHEESAQRSLLRW